MQTDYLEMIPQELARNKEGCFLSFSLVDDPYSQAVAIVFRDRKASASYIQCLLGIDYNRATTLIEKMEEEGIISLVNDMVKRKVFETVEEEYF